MHELGVENLRNAIVEQAVNDYCITVRHIAKLNMKCYAINKIVKEGKKRHYLKDWTLEEAEQERAKRQMLNEAKINQLERFFFSEWYKNICAIDSDYILKATKEKAVDDMVEKCINDLRKVKDKNINTKVSQKRLLEFEILKNFLFSEYLHRFTEKDARSILKYIKEKTNCKHCDFFV